MSYGSIGSASGLLSDDRWCCLAITEASVDMSSTGPHRIKFNKDWYEMLQNFIDGQSTLVALLNHRPCCVQEISIQGNIKLLCIFYHSSKLRWCKYLKSFLMKDKGPPVLHNKYYACTRRCSDNISRSPGFKSYIHWKFWNILVSPQQELMW